jgi:thioredoxin 1
MGENIVELNEQSFNSTVVKGKWVIDMWTEWCGPCKIMEPHFEAVACELKGKAHFGKVNVDDNYALAERFGIMSVPTTLFLKDGELVHISVGALSKEQIIELVKENL